MSATDGTAAITSFTGDYAWLSNFWPWVKRGGTWVRQAGTPDTDELYIDGQLWPSVEHYFQAMKVPQAQHHVRERIRAMSHPTGAKRLGRQVQLREGWEDIKIAVMRRALRVKFADGTPLARALLATGSAPLIEGNDYHDIVWGVCTCRAHGGRGLNYLGLLLQRVREELQ